MTRSIPLGAEQKGPLLAKKYEFLLWTMKHTERRNRNQCMGLSRLRDWTSHGQVIQGAKRW